MEPETLLNILFSINKILRNLQNPCLRITRITMQVLLSCLMVLKFLHTLEMGHEIWLFHWRFDVSAILIISVSISINRMKQYAYDLVSVLLPLTSA